MSNFQKSISRLSVMFVFLSCLLLIIFSNNIAAQKAKSKAKPKRISKSGSGLKSKADLKLAPVILIHGIGGSDLDYQSNSKGMWRNGFPNDVLKGIPGDPQNLQFNAKVCRARTKATSRKM